MQKITKSEIRAGVAQHWKAQYGTEKSDIYKKLKALPKKATDNDIAAIIGNSAWTENTCDECDTDVEMVVQLGQELNYESRTATICPKCLRKALKLIKNP